MTCPICDQKPANCDCTAEERRQHGEIEDLECEIERLRCWANAMLKQITDASFLLQGVPVGSAAYEAFEILNKNVRPQVK